MDDSVEKGTALMLLSGSAAADSALDRGRLPLHAFFYNHRSDDSESKRERKKGEGGEGRPFHTQRHEQLESMCLCLFVVCVCCRRSLLGA